MRNTLQSILSKTKPANNNQNINNCVCGMPCACAKHYLVQTSRYLSVTVKEHKTT